MLDDFAPWFAAQHPYRQAILIQFSDLGDQSESCALLHSTTPAHACTIAYVAVFNFPRTRVGFGDGARHATCHPAGFNAERFFSLFLSTAYQIRLPIRFDTMTPA